MSSAHHSRRSREREEKELPIGPYTRLRQIGKGSFATVYQGTHTKSKTYVAIKSVDTHKLNKKLRANLRLEIDILKGLYHPHIVALIDCQDRTDQIHLVMEYCALGDLSHFIKGRHTLANHRYTRDMIAKYPNPEGGALNEVIVRHFLKQLSSAIQFLRSRDLMHRDIKPQNLLLCPSPSSYRTGVAQVVPFKGSDESFSPTTGLESLPLLKIADFGFARPLPATSLAETLCGSPLYMAPEILRYEKYDAKADLWSVGAVLYEMVVGKPPFRAGNHVDLLRKIQNTKDRIRFPEENPSSEELKALILALLKLNPIERMNFDDFFANEIITGPIPGAVLSDEPSAPEADAAEPARPASRTRLGSPATPSEDDKQAEPAGYPTARRYSSQQTRVDTPPTSSPMRRAGSTDKPKEPVPTTPPQRPSPVSTTTAPGRQELVDRNNSAAVMERQRSRNTYSGVPQQTDKPSDRTREEERAAQEVAFERDYVVVEKRAVEVNAFADELAHSPRIQGEFARGGQVAVPRRQASQGTPSAAATSPQSTPSKAMQVVPGRTRTDSSHSRQNSYERRYGQSPTSATSAISKALNMATGRLWGVGVGFSPPMTKQGRSPPLAHNPFPVYPVVQGNLRLGDGTKTNVAVDEDTRTVQTIEECASRSDVVYGFAEVKYKQLIPLAPSNEGKQNVPGERISDDSSDGGLTVDAVVTLSEEALVLYVKALSLLAKSMDIAGSWWTRKNRGETYSESVNTSAVAGNRINSVVQWVRARFNEVLEKAEFVRLKLLDGQKRLPLDHPCHPNNNTVGSLLGTAGSGTGSAGTGTGSTGSCGAVDVVLSSGVTAEKLMYDRALELSRGAAISELTGQDLSGCEIAYVTAIHMLEAVLEDDEPRSSSRRGEDARKEGDELDQDRLLMVKLVSSIRSRLAALQKKLAILAKRQAPPSGPSKVPSSNLVSVGATPPK